MTVSATLQNGQVKEVLGRAGLAARGVVYIAISMILFLGAFASYAIWLLACLACTELDLFTFLRFPRESLLSLLTRLS